MRQEPERQARFVELVHAHQGAIRKVAALYARDHADREDLFQEIVLQLWRSFDSFRGDAAFSTFLYRVALNTALMRLRRAYRRPEVALEHPPEELAAPEPSCAAGDVERLYAAIRQLSPVDRAIVMLVLDERSYEEIAAVAGLTRANVSVRIVRAKDRLRRLMGVAENAKESKPCPTR